MRGVPKTPFTTGDMLSAQKMNDNFSALDTRLKTIGKRSRHVTLVSESMNTEQAQAYLNLVYQSAHLSLTPGTWLIHASATLTTTTSVDVVQMGLWNDTTSTDVTLSRSPLATTGIPGDGCDGVTKFCGLAPLTTTSIVTVAADTTIQAQGLPQWRLDRLCWQVGPVRSSTFNSMTRLTAVQLY